MRQPGMRTVAGVVLGLVLAAAVPAQDQRDQGFGEVVQVDLVNIEVWVTDREGNPVYGLTASDFVVEEDGDPVEISFFDEIQVPQRLPQPRVVASDAPSEVAAEGESAETLPGTLVLYFDETHLRPTGRERLVEEARSFLATRRVPPENVLIIRQGQELAAEALFDSTLEQLYGALDRIDRGDTAGVQLEAEKRLTFEEIQHLWDQTRELAQGPDASPCDFFLPEAARLVERYSFQSQDHVAKTLEHLYSVSTMLSGVDGMKTLLYLSDSLEMSPGTDLLQFSHDLCPGHQRLTSTTGLTGDLAPAFRALARHASANRVTIYSMQPEGLRHGFMGSAGQRSMNMLGFNALGGNVRQSERSGLGFIADQTGGRAIYNRSDVGEVLDEIGDDMSSYYSLAYSPLHGGDGAEHRVQVKVRRKGLQVRHRLGYRDKDPEQKLGERMVAARHLGLVDNPLGVRLGIGGLQAGEKEWQVPLHVIVPSESLTFLPGPDGGRARIHLAVRAHDQKGRLAVDETSTLDLEEPGESQLSSVAVGLTLRGSALYTVVVAVRDELTAETSIVSTTLEAPEFSRTDGSGAP